MFEAPIGAPEIGGWQKKIVAAKPAACGGEVPITKGTSVPDLRT